MIYAVNRRTKEHRICVPGSMYSDFGDTISYGSDEVLVQATPDGWIGWQGEECPLPIDARTKARYKYSGKESFALSADSISWEEVEAYRPIFDADTKTEAPVWGGESWPPPVGAILESRDDSGVSQAEVIAIRGDKVIGCCVKDHLAGWLMQENWRPIRSEEEMAVEAIEQYGIVLRKGYARNIYNAIRDGKVPGVKLTGGAD